MNFFCCALCEVRYIVSGISTLCGFLISEHYGLSKLQYTLWPAHFRLWTRFCVRPGRHWFQWQSRGFIGVIPLLMRCVLCHSKLYMIKLSHLTTPLWWFWGFFVDMWCMILVSPRLWCINLSGVLCETLGNETQLASTYTWVHQVLKCAHNTAYYWLTTCQVLNLEIQICLEQVLTTIELLWYLTSLHESVNRLHQSPWVIVRYIQILWISLYLITLWIKQCLK